jgi:hypothetical protein
MTRYPTISFAALIAAGIAAIALSCAPSPVRQDNGKVTIVLGGSAGGVRALSTGWPDSTLPIFSSVKIKVSANDMADVETTFTSPGNSISLTVPAGNNRLVEISAVPDWVATASARPNAQLPTFAKSYGGSAKVDLTSGGTATAAITLALTETKILLPDYTTGNTLQFASELSSSAVIESFQFGGNSPYQINSDSDFQFDNRGYLYLNGPQGIYRYSRVNGEFTSEVVSDWLSGDLAYDAPRNRLYNFYDGDGAGLLLFDVTESTMTQYEVVSPDDSYNFSAGSVAVDKDGYIYVPLRRYINDVPNYYIAKLSLGDLVDIVFGTQLVAIADFESLGLTDGTNLQVEDMTVTDGKLYIAAGEHDYYGTYHRGKIVEVSTSNMAKLREFGWSNTSLPNAPSKQFYGPKRFLGLAPRKLIIADEGAVSGVDIDRIAVVDLDSGTISGTYFENAVSFFATYLAY